MSAIKLTNADGGKKTLTLTDIYLAIDTVKDLERLITNTRDAGEMSDDAWFGMARTTNSLICRLLEFSETLAVTEMRKL